MGKLNCKRVTPLYLKSSMALVRSDKEIYKNQTQLFDESFIGHLISAHDWKVARPRQGQYRLYKSPPGK